MSVAIMLLVFALYVKSRRDRARRSESLIGYHGVRLLQCRHASTLEDAMRKCAIELSNSLDSIEDACTRGEISRLEAVRFSEQALSVHCTSVDIIKREEALRALVEDLFTREAK